MKKNTVYSLLVSSLLVFTLPSFAQAEEQEAAPVLLDSADSSPGPKDGKLKALAQENRQERQDMRKKNRLERREMKQENRKEMRQDRQENRKERRAERKAER